LISPEIIFIINWLKSGLFYRGNPAAKRHFEEAIATEKSVWETLSIIAIMNSEYKNQSLT